MLSKKWRISFLLIGCLMFLLSPFFLSCNNNLNGYGGIKWGTSIDAFQRSIPSGYTRTSEGDTVLLETVTTIRNQPYDLIWCFKSNELDSVGISPYQTPDRLTPRFGKRSEPISIINPQIDAMLADINAKFGQYQNKEINNDSDGTGNYSVTTYTWNSQATKVILTSSICTSSTPNCGIFSIIYMRNPNSKRE